MLEDLRARLQAGARGFIQNPDEYKEYADSWDLQEPEKRGPRQQPAEWMMRRIAAHVNNILAETHQKKVETVERTLGMVHA